MKSQTTVRRSEGTERSETQTRSSAPYKLIDSPQTAVANRQWYPGLCRSCVHEPECRFPREAERPLLHCDEFEGVVRPEAPLRLTRRNEAVLTAVANRSWYPGLCSTCDKADSCKFPKPEGGVFHCEEYQ